MKANGKPSDWSLEVSGSRWSTCSQRPCLLEEMFAIFDYRLYKNTAVASKEIGEFVLEPEMNDCNQVMNIGWSTEESRQGTFHTH